MRIPILAALATLAVGLHAQSVTVPNGTNGVEGSSSTAYPWSRAASVIHVQYCYDSTNFTAQGISGPILINRLKWRSNGTTTSYAGGSYANVVVDLSTAASDQASLTTTFASNHGPDRTNVYTGSVTVLPTVSGTPNIFYVDLQLANPFLYDPTTGGDLLMDIAIPASSWTGGTVGAVDCQTTGSLSSRMYNLTSDTLPTGTFGSNIGIVVEVGYLPPSGLFPNFTATPTTGAAPLLVQFTDQTTTSDPGGITAWQWDFNGDTIVDSTLQNPSFTYTACGDYNVTLSVSDATHGTVNTTKNGFVTVDPIAAGFTATGTAGVTPLTVNFTDASTGATTWAWDFDNDNVVDSTLQNPTWVYTAAGLYSVRLAVTNACRADTITKIDFVMAGGVAVPAATQDTEGNSSSAYPFDLASSRVQYIHDASNFIAQGISAPVLINRLRVRANSATTTWAGDTIASLRIDMSTAPVDFLAISSTFASNVGIDVATVYDAPLVIPPGSSTVGTLGPWYIDIPLSTPFLYDPTLGDLTIDYQSSGVPSTANTPSSDAVTTAGVALARRVYTTTPASATGTLTSGEVANVMLVDLVPAIGLFPAFWATPTTGSSPLLVQFTDLSFSSDPGGVVAWQWDFDGDSVVDSTLQSPSFSYTGCGTYSVSLTVTDTTHGQQTLTKPNLITTDPLVVGFSKQNVGGGLFQFTDTSTPTPQTWAWDFDGDSVVDSTLQNPTYTYPVNCVVHDVTLTASLFCRTGTATDRVYVAPASLTAVPFTGGNGSSSSTSIGNMFDVSVTAPDGISVCALTQAVYTYIGPFHVDVYVTDGTYLNVDDVPEAWRLVASGSGVSAGGTSSAPSVCDVPLDHPFYLPAGSYGMVVYISAIPVGTINLCYTTGSATTWGPFSNGDLTINPSPTTAPGMAKLNLFGSGGNNSRVWNGTLHYTKVSLTNTGGYGFLAKGCAGSQPVSTLVAAAAPRLGQTLSVVIDHLPANTAMGVLGFSNTTSVFGPLPLDLGVVGATGCLLRVSNDAQVLLPGAAGTATWNLPIPNLPVLLAAQAFEQVLVIDPTANGFGAVASDAAGFVVGQ